MALHPGFPWSAYAILAPELRWFPADETMRDTAYENLLAPFVFVDEEGFERHPQQAFVGLVASFRDYQP